MRKGVKSSGREEPCFLTNSHLLELPRPLAVHWLLICGQPVVERNKETAVIHEIPLIKKLSVASMIP